MITPPDIARFNETLATLKQAHADRVKRLTPTPTLPQFRTLTDGSIMTRDGRIIFKPESPK